MRCRCLRRAESGGLYKVGGVGQAVSQAVEVWWVMIPAAEFQRYSWHGMGRACASGAASTFGAVRPIASVIDVQILRTVVVCA